MSAFLERSIREAVIKRIGEIVAEESDAAMSRVKERISAEIDQIALSISRTYELESMTDRIVITVRKP